jgi:nicotinamidase-related amidase
MPTALLVIDVQLEYFDGEMPVEFPPIVESLERIGAAMDAATAAGVPVVVVRHAEEPGFGMFEAGTPLWELHSDVADRPRDLLIDKTLPGTFTGTELGEWVTANGIDHLTIVGYMTNVCCDTTARQALHRGMGATILADAVGTPEMPAVDGGTVPAADVQRSTLATLALIGAEIISTDAWIANLAPEG